MFHPPRCPYPACPMHRDPEPGFCVRNGHYQPRCRAQPIARFICKRCDRGFSRQTFRMDYRDHRPDLNPRLFMLLASGLGLRQCGRLLPLSLRATELKFRKIARHLRGLNRNARGPLPPDAVLQLDEFETYEGRRGVRPLTLPVLIDRNSRFVLAARSAPIRPSGKSNPARRAAVAADESRFGRRQSRSRAAVRWALRRAAPWCGSMRSVVLETDEKSTYLPLAATVFGDRLVHCRTSSRLPRDTWNPLFPINHTEAMARDLNGRLRRDSWLASKLRWFLNLQLEIFAAYRNFVRRRFNRDSDSPAQLVGVMKRRLRPPELLAWRQDWGSLSVPLGGASEWGGPLGWGGRGEIRLAGR